MLLAALVSYAKFTGDAGVVPDLDVVLLPPEVEPVVVEPLQPIDIPEPLVREGPLPEPVAEPVDERPQDAPVDWYALMQDEVRNVVSSEKPAASVNPEFDARRREAAIKFAPSRAPVKTPIWENVEVDQLGRKFLVSGNCYRVIDDPSAANYDIFHALQQYITYCWYYKRPPKELPWVEDIREQYAYLQ